MDQDGEVGWEGDKECVDAWDLGGGAKETGRIRETDIGRRRQ